MAGFGQADAQLAGVTQQQVTLRAAVDAGELWMDADVAERAAARRDQAVRELDDWLINARELPTSFQEHGGHLPGGGADGGRS